MLGCLLIVIVVVMTSCGDDDEDSGGDEQETSTVTETSEGAASDAVSATAWCARTEAVLADVDDGDLGVSLEQVEAWLSEAPPEMVEAAQEYQELLFLAPPIAAADADYDSKFADARAAVDAYVSQNC